MDKYKSVDLGGMPFVLNDFRWFLGQIVVGNQGIYAALNNLLRGFGDDFIVQGCTLGGVSGAYTLTEGWIMLGGELLKVDAQAAFNEAINSKFIKVTTYDSAGDKQMRNGATAQTYQVNRGVISGTSGNLAYNGDTLEDLIVPSFLLTDLIPNPGTPSVIKIKKKILKIGDWNMDSTVLVSISHGLTLSKIKTAKVSIIEDNNQIHSMVSEGLTSVKITSTSVILTRTASGAFDISDFSGTSFNRGFINIEYEL